MYWRLASKEDVFEETQNRAKLTISCLLSLQNSGFYCNLVGWFDVLYSMGRVMNIERSGMDFKVPVSRSEVW